MCLLCTYHLAQFIRRQADNEEASLLSEVSKNSAMRERVLLHCRKCDEAGRCEGAKKKRKKGGSLWIFLG